MLSAMKNVEPLYDHIESVAIDIIKDTFDYCIRHVEDISVLDTYVTVYYENSYGGSYDQDSVKIPIEWFDEGFDYKSAYREILREAEEKRIAEEAEKKKKEKELQKKKDYNTYLELKKKYENGELT
jgi:hypothetical protein